MKIKRLLAAAVAAAGLFLSGCASMEPPARFEVTVDSIASAESATKRSYVLAPGDKSVNETDLQYQEFASYVHKVLGERGFTKAGALQDAQLLVFLTYGIGDPQAHQYTYEVPKFGQTGVASSSTFGTASLYGNRGTYSATTTYTPTFGVVGSTTHVATEVTYTRSLTLDAYDAPAYAADKKLAQVWKTSVRSTGSSDDLRRVLPYMVWAAKPLLATNTGKKIAVTVLENEPGVQALRAEAQQASSK